MTTTTTRPNITDPAVEKYIAALEAEVRALRGLPALKRKRFPTVEFEHTFTWHDNGETRVYASVSYEVEDDETIYIHNVESAKACDGNDIELLGILDTIRIDELEKRAKEIVQARQ